LYANQQKGFELLHDYHFGGYAKHQSDLLQFMNAFYAETGIHTDFVYTAKAFFAAFDLLNKGYFSERDRLLLLHTGGLQGNLSLPKGTLIFG
jgi:1-aminocyclopropane-1-carboxylate deaminase